MLFSYMQQVQRFLRDAKQQFIDPEDLISYINRARREVAMRSQSIRVLTPVAGSIVTIQVTNGGTGYTGPTITVSAPDAPNGALPNPAGVQATASAIVIGGSIVSISVGNGGDGYQFPHVTITDPHGTGATAVASTNPINVTRFQQEIYRFSDVPPSVEPGVGAMFAVKGVDLIYANFRYSIPIYPFTQYTTWVRQFPNQYSFVPTIGSQYGWGTNGSFYLYPLPSQAYAMEWDAFHLPVDITDDQMPEAIPMPWTETVPYFAAHMAFLELQNLNAAKYYLELYDAMNHRYSAYARALGRSVNPFGRF